MIDGLHHVQLAMPEGGEDAARAFYGGVLGMTEAAKPSALVGRGGVWFEAGGARVHLGVERPFVPARKAHPCLLVADVGRARARLAAAGVASAAGEDLPDLRRVYVADPFGNRIEIAEIRP
ncbi:catechol 2,3-dioxygenase-like lactoylglutathione lyase family enzyme [Hasllibacter halocynthiae]|uniref:Catechol 2,3-dioxygenase-like lactoylglutathione lyase family enzyme n=1 Tax=Hasllibacter halocynthiae TaxID=595589 RepID=A0A2T0X114_9RHOB|nr:VOC family protein [Hasllibacter halocynthiae]PRY92638.1 catechol 2,3-dioxygenase-like lactoylglutathione lyase family enzyme [Hasllibacter halocynthiae]